MRGARGARALRARESGFIWQERAKRVVLTKPRVLQACARPSPGAPCRRARAQMTGQAPCPAPWRTHARRPACNLFFCAERRREGAHLERDAFLCCGCFAPCCARAWGLEERAGSKSVCGWVRRSSRSDTPCCLGLWLRGRGVSGRRKVFLSVARREAARTGRRSGSIAGERRTSLVPFHATAPGHTLCAHTHTHAHTRRTTSA